MSTDEPTLEDALRLIRKLDIQVGHPSMSGDHQCSVRGDRKRLAPEDWDLIRRADELDRW